MKRLAMHLLVLLAALALSGCASSGQAKNIIEQTNALLAQLAEQRDAALDAADAASTQALLQSTDLDPMSLDAQGDAKAWKPSTDQLLDAVGQIDDFIAAHPHLSAAGDSLRVRKALLLATAGKPNVAQAAFDEVQSAGSNVRDQGLYQNRMALTWWFANSTATPNFSGKPAFIAQLDEHIASFAESLKELPAGSDIALYLAAIRAHMTWKRATYDGWDADSPAETQAGKQAMKARLVQGLTEYCAMFTEEQRVRVRAWVNDDASIATRPAEGWRLLGQAQVVWNRYKAEAPAAAWDTSCQWLTETP